MDADVSTERGLANPLGFGRPSANHVSMVSHGKPLPLALYDYQMTLIKRTSKLEMRKDRFGLVHWVYSNTGGAWLSPCYQEFSRGITTMRTFSYDHSEVDKDACITCLGCIAYNI